MKNKIIAHKKNAKKNENGILKANQTNEFAANKKILEHEGPKSKSINNSFQKKPRQKVEKKKVKTKLTRRISTNSSNISKLTEPCPNENELNEELMMINKSKKDLNEIKITNFSMSGDDFSFRTVTLVIDSNDHAKITQRNLYTILIRTLTNLREKIDEDKLSIRIYDIDRNKNLIYQFGLREKLLENYSNKIEIMICEDFNSAFMLTDIVISMISSPGDKESFFQLGTIDDRLAFSNYEESLLGCENLKGLKYISIGSMSYETVVFYHYFFAHNEAYFVEAPLLRQIEILNDELNDGDDSVLTKSLNDRLQIYVSCSDVTFFNSIKYLFEGLANTDNIHFKGAEFGFSNIYVDLAEPIVSHNRKLFENCIKLVQRSMLVKCIDSSNFTAATPKSKTIRSLLANASKEIVNNKFYLEKELYMIEKIGQEVKSKLSQSIDSILSDFKSNHSGKSDSFSV